jgi:hypothetical protein
MASQIKKSKKSGAELENTCAWCDKTFRSASTLAVHMCPKKRRWADKDATHIRLAFRVFQKFYLITSRAAQPKTIEDFIQSQYYEGFVKFGRSCISNEYLDPEQYAEWLIRQSKKLKDWSADSTYNEWLREHIKNELAPRAAERTIKNMMLWAEDNNAEWVNYFRQVSTSRAVHDLRSGKISPWFLYLSDSGAELLVKFSPEQVKMIASVIDADFWKRQFTTKPSDVTVIRMACEEAGI